MSDEVADLLDGAADRLEHDGWVKGGYSLYDYDADVFVGYCAVGAIRAVVDFDYVNDWDNDENDTEEYLQALAAVTSLITSAVPIPGSETWVIGWNDEKERTKQEVLDVFRLAAKEQRS